MVAHSRETSMGNVIKRFLAGEGQYRFPVKRIKWTGVCSDKPEPAQKFKTMLAFLKQKTVPKTVDYFTNGLLILLF